MVPDVSKSSEDRPSAWDLPPLQALLPASLQPSTSWATTRIGPSGDGGYEVADDILDHVGWIVSLGLCDDWRFEKQLQERTGAPLLVLDGSVDAAFWAMRTFVSVARPLHPRAAELRATINNETGYLRYRRFFADPTREHRRANVGYSRPGWQSLPEILAERPDAGVFLKSDIEGWEWRILDDIVAHRDRLVGLAIEFHSVDLLLPRLVDFVARMPEFTVIDVVANNFGAIAPDGTPEVIEMALARTDLLVTEAPVGRTTLAQPNSRIDPPIEVQFA